VATFDLTIEDIRVLQHAEERADRGFTVSIISSMARYRRLAEAGFLEHRTASMDAEWFGITDKGREAVTQAMFAQRSTERYVGNCAATGPAS
jgi:hypothetical protein